MLASGKTKINKSHADLASTGAVGVDIIHGWKTNLTRQREKVYHNSKYNMCGTKRMKQGVMEGSGKPSKICNN